MILKTKKPGVNNLVHLISTSAVALVLSARDWLRSRPDKCTISVEAVRPRLRPDWSGWRTGVSGLQKPRRLCALLHIKPHFTFKTQFNELRCLA